MINKLLLVNSAEDESLLKYLKDSGYLIVFCKPNEIIKTCKKVAPQIILILDMQDDLELVELLSNPDISSIPAIHATTGYPVDDTSKHTKFFDISKKVNIYKSLINMKIISDKLSNIIAKQVDIEDAF